MILRPVRPESFLVQHPGRHGGLDDQLDQVPADLLGGGLGGVLGGDDDGVDAHHIAVLVVLHSDLGLAVGPQIVHHALLADLGEALGQLVAE